MLHCTWNWKSWKMTIRISKKALSNQYQNFWHHDNPKLIFGLVKDYLQKAKVNFTDWLTQRTNSNPIKNLYSELRPWSMSKNHQIFESLKNLIIINEPWFLRRCVPKTCWNCGLIFNKNGYTMATNNFLWWYFFFVFKLILFLCAE